MEGRWGLGPLSHPAHLYVTRNFSLGWVLSLFAPSSGRQCCRVVQRCSLRENRKATCRIFWAQIDKDPPANNSLPTTVGITTNLADRSARPFSILFAQLILAAFSPQTFTMSSLWNAFTGGNKPKSQTSDSSMSSSPYSTSTPTTIYDPSMNQGTDGFLQSSTFADPSQMHPLAGLNKDSLEYLSLEDSALSDLPGGQSVLPSRGFTDDLCYGTGVTYLSGLSVGGALGLREGLMKSQAQAPKLRLNSVLNAVTRRGPYLGNSAGTVAITYNCINSLIGYVRGKHDAANSVLGGFLSGCVFKSTRGVRSMIISGGIVASIAGAWAVSFFPPATDL